MKIYLASRYSRMKEMQTYKALLEEHGHEVTAQWVDGAEETLGARAEGAIMDFNDVARADILLQFTDPYGSSHTGGGRHCEFGIAAALDKLLFIVGDREQIFHHLPQVQQFETLNGVIAFLKNYPLHMHMSRKLYSVA